MIGVPPVAPGTCGSCIGDGRCRRHTRVRILGGSTSSRWRWSSHGVSEDDRRRPPGGRHAQRRPHLDPRRLHAAGGGAAGGAGLCGRVLDPLRLTREGRPRNGNRRGGDPARGSARVLRPTRRRHRRATSRRRAGRKCPLDLPEGYHTPSRAPSYKRSTGGGRRGRHPGQRALGNARSRGTPRDFHHEEQPPDQ